MLVLVVDDDPSILELIKVNLEIDGMDVITAANGKQGIEKAVKSKPDLIIMDMMMPEMNGNETTLALKRKSETKSIPVIMLTAKSQVKDVELSFQAGADSYITKPFEPLDLAPILRDKLSKIKKKNRR